MRSNNFHALFFLSIALFCSCGKSGNPNQTPPPINVAVTAVSSAGETESYRYSGTIEESEAIPLSFAMPGTVSHVLVSEGQSVRKGQLLARLDNTTARHAYEMSLATEKRAEDAFKRLSPMHQNGTIPEIKFIEVQTDLDQAKSATAIAKKNEDDCNLYATTDGFVGKRNIEPGMSALPGITSISIVKIRKVFASIAVSESDIAVIKKGQKAGVAVAALGSRIHDGLIEEIGVMADPLAHTYKVKIALDNGDLALRPGMVCTAVIHALQDASGITVPAAALLLDESGKNYVYVVDEKRQTADRRQVRLGRLLNDHVEVLEGLDGRECIVHEGQHKLFPHAPIRIVNR